MTPDGGYAVSASSDNTLRVWDLGSGEAVHTMEGHSDWVSAVSVTPDGRYAVSGSYDGTLRMWDLGSGESVHTLEGHTDVVSAVSVTPDGSYAVSGSSDRTFRVWDLHTGEALVSFSGNGPMGDCATTPGGSIFVGGDTSGQLHILHLERRKTSESDS